MHTVHCVLYRVFVEDNAFLGFRGGQSGWLLPTLVSMSRGVRILADEVCRVITINSDPV